MSNVKSIRDNLRAKAFKSREGNSRVVEFDGEKYLLKAPTFALQERVDAEGVTVIKNPKGKVIERRPNTPKRAALMLIYSVFTMDGEAVFERTDLEALMDSPVNDNSFIGTMLAAFADMAKKAPSVEEEMGNSDASLTAEPS